MQAFYWLLWSSTALRIMPFKKLISKLESGQMQISKEQEPDIRKEIHRIAKAIHQARSFAFWRPKCYPQAIAAKIMLRRRHIPATLYIGVNKKDDIFRAHAWTLSQDIVLTGKKVASDFSVLATFS